MDLILQRMTQQAMQYALRSGISITTGYAIKECARLYKQAPKSRDREELMLLQQRLESKIRVISPSIDMIELIAARGNTSLESAVSLTKDIRYEIQKLGKRLQDAANDEELLRHRSNKAKSREDTSQELKGCIDHIKLLLARIEDAVPLINLAITTSGVNLSTKLSGTISPSRLLQASTFLTSADSQYSTNVTMRQQVGSTYVLTLYMLFAGHATRPVTEHGVRETTWKEVIHKARVKLWRIPLEQLYTLPGEHTQADGHDAANTIPGDAKASEFAYQLSIVEDLDDDRHHNPEDEGHSPGPVDDVLEAGIRDVIPIHEISKIFYADTGKILNIGGDGDAYSPVLLLKRDVHAEPPRRMLRRSQSRVSINEGVANTSISDDDDQDDQTEIDAQFERESAPPTPLNDSESAPQETHAWRLPADLDPEWMALEVYTEDDESESDIDTSPEPERPGLSRAESLEPGLSDALANLNMNSDGSSSDHHLAPNKSQVLQLSPGRRAGPALKSSLSLLEMLMKLAALQQFRQESHLAIEDELLNFFLEDSATAGAGADKQYRQQLRQTAARRVGFDPYDESPVKRRGEDYIRNAGEAASPRGSPGSGLLYRDGFDGLPVPQLDFAARPSIERLGSRLPSSPPQRPPYQTPSRTSTPDTSEGHQKTVRAKYAGDTPSPPSPPAARASAESTTTTANGAKTRAATLRSKTDSRPRSPLRVVADGEE
ncbi:Ran-specific GTPase-activating protein 30 [Fulvia fulva]|uniref:Ran-specific GTPase-activating protein 30 n=1 Tax=Passalora fulva TaxID=5499 RepID=A0A9Q8P3S9_PASFU|nr:Ran-specific GTPase-activating protein 30 [Fulvia fulva]KAK4635783.1 Ran-specific GTPase-activating protein 30 [Fulvia fulva]KAK4638204.1 Ran-specific GTPase-activating protein 30 [Fulvia fulva]UJO12345.1 Ran-specific GTPase-activating protein 30 [Fulvia fulva]WPV10113.1 Ran-specific GTPase-activating protein 30 [Fulvia fulva]WPV25261.1 Ran-specific GTPase-activating protein 30 [Fulvia fulva]